MRVKLYIEGGGDRASEQGECREGFRVLLRGTGIENRMPRTKACGSREAAFRDFDIAVKKTADGEYPVLLVDSEGPVSQPAWEHLRARDGWVRPNGVDHDQAQLMVQCMESWCVGDRAALQAFFGQCLVANALPPLNDLEERAKDDVQTALVNATHPCGRDRAYAKGSRSFDLLGSLDPAELKKHLPHFVRFCDTLDQKL